MVPSKMNPTKRACDGCKIRKVKCAGGHPCKACVNARIKCTYIRVQQSRGPQKLRATTKHLIEQTQRNGSASADPSECDATSSSSPKSPTNTLASLLYIYHVRMYPVWPIVHVDGLIAALQQDPSGNDNETRALATAVAAATLAQLRLGEDYLPDQSITAETFAFECLKARGTADYRAKVNLNTIRTAFFLHVYYENQQPGGSESVLYLREAISLAQMMYLHREASYAGLSPAEQEIRRRVLWLLFVTERGVCILHKIPVVLKTDTAMPEIDSDDAPQVLPAFLKLLVLFKLFEQSRMFDTIENYHLGLPPPIGSSKTSDTTFYDLLQEKLRDEPGALDGISDIQRADLCVTRHWMRILAWKALSHHSIRGSHLYQGLFSPVFPVLVARDLVNVVWKLPHTALQAHGLGMQLKLREIANSLADAITNLAMLPEAPMWDQASRPSSILARLNSILSAFRDGGNNGGKNALVEILYHKMAGTQSLSGLTLLPPSSSTRPVEERGCQIDNVRGAPGDGSGVVGLEVLPNMSTHTRGAGDYPEWTLPGMAWSMTDDSAGHGEKQNQQNTPSSEAPTLSNFSDQNLGDLWSYVQSTYSPLIYTAPQQFNPSTATTNIPPMSALFDPSSVDMVFNNLIFEAPRDPLSPGTYLTMIDPTDHLVARSHTPN